MAEPIAFLRGLYRPVSESLLSIHDPGFSGIAAADNCRTWNGTLFRWPEHVARLRRDCDACCFPLKYTDDELSAIAEKLLAQNISAAEPDLYLITQVTPASFGMWTRPVDRARNEAFRDRGATVKIVGHQPVAADALLPPRIKHRSRLHWHIARHLAGDALPLLLDRPGGTITETDIACVLAVFDGVLTTPPRGLILDSISLQVTLELAARFGIPCAERPITADQLKTAGEAMLTGTGFGLAGISRIDDAAMAWPGPVTDRLIEAWSNEIGVDLRKPDSTLKTGLT